MVLKFFVPNFGNFLKRSSGINVKNIYLYLFGARKGGPWRGKGRAYFLFRLGKVTLKLFVLWSIVI